MSGTDSARTLAASRWKSWLPLIYVTLAIVAGSLVARQFGGPRRAEAQAPVRTTSPAKGSAGAPKSGPAPIVSPNAKASPNAAATAPAPRDPGVVAPVTKTSAVTTKDLKVMAVVNGEQITRQELGKECLRRYGKDVLEGMLNKQLISDACTKQGIKITDKELNEEVDRIASKFGLPRDRWLAMLQDERGYTEEDYRQEVVWPMLAMRKLALDKIQVSQADLQKAIESDYGPKVKARLIVAASQAKAKELHKKVTANPDSFNDVAKEGDDPSVASARGMIPLIRKNVGDPKLEQAAFALKPGQISPIVFAANQYFIVKCEQQLPGQVLEKSQLDEIKRMLTERLKEQKTRTAATDLFEKLQQESKVENVFNDEKKQKANPGVAAILNGQPISILQLTEECVQRHGREILDGEINRKILTQELAKKKQTVTEQDLDTEVARTAELYGFVKNGQPDVEKWLKHIEEEEHAPVELYVRDAVWPAVALRKLVGTKIEITDEDLKKAYESHYGPKVEVQAIVVSDQRQAQKVWEQARGNPTEEFFAKLAEQNSIEPVSKANGGKVPPIRKYGGQGAIEDEAFKLKVGELSGIVAMGDRFIIMRCLGRTKPMGVKLEDAKEELAINLREQKLRVVMTAEMDRLKNSAQIDNFLAGVSQSGKRVSTAPPASKANAAVPVGPAPAGKYDVVPATATRPTMKK